KEAYEKIKEMNATVVDVDKSAFKARVKPLYDEFKAKDAQSAKNLEQVENM
ncbi:TRAP transporter substrate-binding protein, partial [Escherichia albertii]|nr:TRAP transporter substrate-binding protein [Escherichia albertii]MCZ8614408.1 TRAP transporter substrate-binding protein [Escherichia albertii]MCZ8622795.1 TRAP transporter substrate-binding protein [Escherichia albertii]MCZ8646264.1 TRAP transporter substrate-binding protein [Escherichia albertii]MCZ8685969.1 TRAP transporter substrate-binding protein [Escherichia albertii]